MTSKGRLPLPLLLGIATAFSVSSSVQSYLLARVSEGKSPDMLLHIFVLNLVYWYVPALLAPVIVNIATRYRLERKPWYMVLPLHVIGAFTYSAIHTSVMLVTRAALMQGPPPRGWWFVARIEYLHQLDWLFMTYLFLVGLAHALAYRRESERRALRSAQLEMRLVESQLQALQHQVHPHFLFNALNAISGLMRTDVDSADRMMDRLGDLLRMTLRSSNVQELPLKEELELLQKYLEIEQMRFGNRLTVSFDIAPETFDAQVPNFLLQPLVENAVRHGIVPYTRSGSIYIGVHRVGEELTLQVLDSGNGVLPHRLTLLNQGVGLANTRARLEHLYRKRQSLVFANDPAGFRVTVTIPFVVEREAEQEQELELEAGERRVTKIRTLVVDDEPIARARVVSLLNGEGDIEVVGECSSGQQALSAIQTMNLDLLFLDIQMPEGNGLELARALQLHGMPAVVFVTAYDEYALKAFEVHALDYVLKPFSAERFLAALGHARDHVVHRRRPDGAPDGQGTALPAGAPLAPGGPRDRLMIRSSGRIYFVRMAEIDWCEADGNYVRVHVGAQEHLVRDTMARLESELDPRQFVRIHRSTIVNVDRIQEMQSSFNGEYVVQLRTGARLTLSRGYRDAIQSRLGRPF